MTGIFLRQLSALLKMVFLFLVFSEFKPDLTTIGRAWGVPLKWAVHPPSMLVEIIKQMIDFSADVVLGIPQAAKS